MLNYSINLSNFIDNSDLLLKISGISTSRLDILVLLSDVLIKEKAWILANPERKLSHSQLKKLNGWLERRTNHEPLAYIRGKSEFYGREFAVSSDTLEPRPETETIIDQIKVLIKVHSTKHNSPTGRGGVKKWKLNDIGTGSGCLAITAKLEMPFLEVLASDISKSALKIARRNSQILGADVTFVHGNLLEPLANRQLANSILICNLPYVPDSHTINQAAMFEPKLAIFGGPDGLDLYRQMFKQIEKFSLMPKYVITESLPPQHPKLTKIAQEVGYKLINTADFIQTFTRS